MLWVLCLSAQALLIGAIIQRKLLRAYPFFVAYLTVDLGCSLALLQIPYQAPDYAKAFRTYQILAAVLQVGMAGEMFQRLCWHFREFRGFGQFRFFMAAALLARTGIFFLAVFPGVPAPAPSLMAMWLMRWETTVLAITLALSWWVLTRFLGLRPRIRSNALAHGRILIVFFAITALSDGLNLIAQRKSAIHAMNVLMLTGDLACFIAWIVCLRRDGEQLPPELPVSPEALAYSRFWRRRILEHVQQARR